MSKESTYFKCMKNHKKSIMTFQAYRSLFPCPLTYIEVNEKFCELKEGNIVITEKAQETRFGMYSILEIMFCVLCDPLQFQSPPAACLSRLAIFFCSSSADKEHLVGCHNLSLQFTILCSSSPLLQRVSLILQFSSAVLLQLRNI